MYCKYFTCFTKTIANLTTYSRKPGDYNGTIIFEIDIMENSSQLNLIFTIFAMSKPITRLFITLLDRGITLFEISYAMAKKITD